jgi:N utilization substance protein B
MKVRRRTVARRLALQLLYEFDIRGELDDKRVGLFLRRFAPVGYINRYVRALLKGVLLHRKELDSLISNLCKKWDYERVSAVERSILRIAAYEMVYGGVPAKSAIEEAVELAKRFASSDAASFINGILHSLATQKGLFS